MQFIHLVLRQRGTFSSNKRWKSLSEMSAPRTPSRSGGKSDVLPTVRSITIALLIVITKPAPLASRYGADMVSGAFTFSSGCVCVRGEIETFAEKLM